MRKTYKNIGIMPAQTTLTSPITHPTVSAPVCPRRRHVWDTHGIMVGVEPGKHSLPPVPVDEGNIHKGPRSDDPVFEVLVPDLILVDVSDCHGCDAAGGSLEPVPAVESGGYANGSCVDGCRGEHGSEKLDDSHAGLNAPRTEIKAAISEMRDTGENERRERRLDVF